MKEESQMNKGNVLETSMARAAPGRAAARDDGPKIRRAAPTNRAGFIAAVNGSATAQLASPDDGSLIDALRRGDESAFARLVDQHQASLSRVARLYIANRAVADEVVQDTWLGVIQGIWAFEGRSSLKTWILRILINRAKTRAAREGRTVPFACFDAGPEGGEAAVGPDDFQPADHLPQPGHWTRPSPDLGTSPERRLLAQEARQRLRSAIEALPERQRLVLILHDVEGCSTEEVCNALGFQQTNTRVLLHRARVKVRVALEPYLKGA
jgi:RNA polymerase sigma-70 factor, ECF subfamily